MPGFGGMGRSFGAMGAQPHPPSSAAGAAFTPASLSPALWIDPSDTATMFQSNAGSTAVTDGSVCGYAGDKSGNSFNLTSLANDASRPTWVANAGLSYLSFNGTSQWLQRAMALGLYAAAANSVFVAV